MYLSVLWTNGMLRPNTMPMPGQTRSFARTCANTCGTDENYLPLRHTNTSYVGGIPRETRHIMVYTIQTDHYNERRLCHPTASNFSMHTRAYMLARLQAHTYAKTTFNLYHSLGKFSRRQFHDILLLFFSEKRL